MDKSFINKLDEEWIEDMFIYSLRYTLYSPCACIDFLTPLIPELSNETLWCMSRDIEKYVVTGPYKWYEKEWLGFKEKIDTERTKRNETG